MAREVLRRAATVTANKKRLARGLAAVGLEGGEAEMRRILSISCRPKVSSLEDKFTVRWRACGGCEMNDAR